MSAIGWLVLAAFVAYIISGVFALVLYALDLFLRDNMQYPFWYLRVKLLLLRWRRLAKGWLGGYRGFAPPCKFVVGHYYKNTLTGKISKCTANAYENACFEGESVTPVRVFIAVGKHDEPVECAIHFGRELYRATSAQRGWRNVGD